jgi:Rod binding domain-containing protein
MYRQMLDGELAKSMAAQKGMGLARMMEESLTAAAVARASGPDRQAPLPVDPVGPQPAKMMDENKRSTANRPKVAPLAGR